MVESVNDIRREFDANSDVRPFESTPGRNDMIGKVIPGQVPEIEDGQSGFTLPATLQAQYPALRKRQWDQVATSTHEVSDSVARKRLDATYNEQQSLYMQAKAQAAAQTNSQQTHHMPTSPDILQQQQLQLRRQYQKRLLDAAAQKILQQIPLTPQQRQQLPAAVAAPRTPQPGQVTLQQQVAAVPHQSVTPQP